MRSTALACKDEYDDEVPVRSQDVLEANVASIRKDLDEFKTDFRAAVIRLDNDIKAAVSELRAEIRAVAAKAESDLKVFANRIESQLAEMRTEDKALRNKIDGLSKSVITINSKLNAFFWVVSLLIAIAGLGKALRWF
jgi:chromosome segregation ATPase